MPPIPLVGPSSSVRTWSLDRARCVNLYPEMTEGPKGKSIAALLGTPGLRRFCTLPNTGPIRGLQATADGRAFAVQGSGLYELQADGSFTLRGTLGDTVGRVGMASSFTQLGIDTDGPGYVLTLSTNAFTEIPGANYYASTMISTIDGYAIHNRFGTAQFFISALNDWLTYDALDFASVEGVPGALLAHVADHRELWLFKARGTEVFFNSGAADFPFQRIEGSFIEQGIAPNAIWTAATLDNSVFWVGHNEDGGYIVWRATGYQPQRISTHSVEYDLENLPVGSTLTAYAYQQEGHSFYCLNLPETTWVYDAATQLWHERCAINPLDGTFTRCRAEWHMYCFGKHLVGDFADGRIYELDLDYYKDDTNPLVAERIFPYVTGDGVRLRHHRLEVECEAGVGLDAGVVPGTDPQMMLQWSDTDGKGWSNEHHKSMGPLGKHRQRVVWTRLGQSWHRLYKLRISDPVKRAIVTAYLWPTGDKS